ncbi:glutamine synthetase family protein [Streptomyces sp. NPDC006879]|uniref:glutamine synthetase family protein n=1 Tax=Streptomyces sp. NPDC006879 TaxID=3364767 RepID=UPI0036C3757B
MYSRSWSTLFAEASVGRPSFVAEFGLWNEEQNAAAAEIEASLGEIDFVRLVFADPHGLARSKTLTVDTFRTVLRNGADYSPGPFLFDTGHAVAVDFLDADPGVGVAELAGAGNFVLVPDPLTFMVLPHGGGRTAWVLGDEYQRDGSPHPLSARHVLRKVLARYCERALTPVLGLEVEWYLTRRLPGPPGNTGNGFGTQGPAPRVEAVNAGYQFNLDGNYDSVSDLTGPLALALQGLGLPLRSMEHESGPGQVETTFSPMTALDTADAMVIFRTLTKQFCARRGHHASFMSLPRLDSFDPSGWHLHQSVRDDRTGANLFAPAGRPDGMSAQGRAYVEGLLSWASDLCLLSVPTVNGYRRLGADFSLSPTRIGWTFEDRSAMIRVVGGEGSRHFENRTGEPSANPYLAIAGQLFSGLEGLTGAPSAARYAASGAGRDGAPYRTLPQSLDEALEAFRSGPAEELLGKPLTATLTKLKESEVARFEKWREEAQPPVGQVTEWEQREYFEHF